MMMDVMLKSMGFNADEVKENIKTAAQEFKLMKEQLQRIEEKCDKIIANTDKNV